MTALPRISLGLLLCAACDPVSLVLVRSRAGETRAVHDSSTALPEAVRDASALDAGGASSARDGGMATGDAATPDAAVGLDAAADAAAPRDPGVTLATATIDYYHAARESDYPGAGVALSTSSCGALLTTSRGFANALCIQGTGITNGGRVVMFDDLCACGYACPTAAAACFREVNASTFPFGQGSSGRALIPMRSLAVDPSQGLAGKVLYVPRLDGLEVAAGPGIAVFTHDGCVRADDGAAFGATLGMRLFTGDLAHYQATDSLLPTGTSLQVNEDAPHCAAVFP